MSNISTSTSSNVFYQARCEASKFNEQLSSRDGAAELMAINPRKLYKIEIGIEKPLPEETHLMADLYKAPELRNYHCKNCCPLGANIPEAKNTELDRIMVRTVATFRHLEETKNQLLDIAEDGKVSEDEKEDLAKALETLNQLETITQEWKLWIEKNL